MGERRTCARCLRTYGTHMFRACVVDGNVSSLDGKPRPCYHSVHCRLFPSWCRACVSAYLGDQLHPLEVEQLRALVEESRKIVGYALQLA